MAHPFSNRPSFVDVHEELFGFGAGRPLNQDADEVLSAFARLHAPKQADMSVWSEYASMQSGTFHALQSDLPDARNDLYLNLFGTPLTHGFAQGHVVLQGLQSAQSSRLHVGKIVLDRFYRLAEALGVLRITSAEHGQTTIEVGNPDVILSMMESVLDIDLSPPPQAGLLFGLKTSRGIYSDRHFDGIYGAWRASQWLKQTGKPLTSLVEIGGGAGHLSYYARKFGFETVSIIDLPQALCAQYILLADVFGPEQVGLGGEPEKPIRLIFHDDPFADIFASAQIVVNVDSFPEMPKSAAYGYVENIPAGTPLLSINQESAIDNGVDTQNVVSEIAAAHGMTRLLRYPAWLRTGWVEEIFQRN